MTSNEYNEYDFYFYENESSPSIKEFAKNNPALTTGIAIGSIFTATTLISPKVRKVTIPTCKFLAKQQLKILAGIGLFSIANLLVNEDDDVNL